MIRLIFMRLIVRQHSCCYSVSSIYRTIMIMYVLCLFYSAPDSCVFREELVICTNLVLILYICAYNEICSFQALHFFSLFISLTPRIMILFPFILFYCTQQKTFIIPEIFLTGLQNTVYGLIIFLYSKRTQNGRLF